MTIVVWAVTEVKRWLAEEQALLAQWPALTGRKCPHCGRAALVGHGQRRRSVHVGRRPGRRGPACGVQWLWVQRVRCGACGKTHTLLPGFLAPYQRHPSAGREGACREREAGASWRQVLARLGLAMLSATSPRRWVARVRRELPGMAAAVRRWRSEAAAGAGGTYAPVEAPGSLAAFAAAVQALLGAQGQGWPAAESLAGANWQAGVRGHPGWV